MTKYIKAVWAFLRAFLLPADLIVKRCEKGHDLLATWESCPECLWLSQVQKNSKSALEQPIRAQLVCIRGRHLGEVISLDLPVETLGAATQNSRTLSVAPEFMDERFRLLTGESNVLLSKTNQDQLFDYDTVEILGNQFVFLDLRPYTAAGNEPEELGI